MKPAPFDYVAPETVAEAISLLGQHGDAAKVLAGGQSLVPLLNMRLARPSVLVDINRVDELQFLRTTADGSLAIGAITRQRRAERAELVQRGWPILSEAIAEIGHFQIRNRGTVGGSLVHADPAAELPAAMLALEAILVAHGPAGPRRIPAADFFVSYLTTALEPEELLTEIQVPPVPRETGWSVVEVSRRHGDFALVGACVLLFPGATNCLAEARISLFGVGPTPLRAHAAEELLAGEVPSAALFREAAHRAEAVAAPDDDLHASAAYRRAQTSVVVERALERAAARLQTREGIAG